MGKKKFFDFVIGNPPYQESMASTSDKSVYNILMDASYEVGQKSEFITPARFCLMLERHQSHGIKRC